MHAATAALAAKAARSAAKALLSIPAPRKGRWSGAYAAKRTGKLWEVVQSQKDPMRLWVEVLDLEYAWAGCQTSDGGSIPHACQAIKGLRLKPDSFLKSYFLHDALYARGGAFVREPGRLWHWVGLERREADALLYCGLCSEGATLAEAQTIYRAVRMFGRHAWNKCRAAEAAGRDS